MAFAISSKYVYCPNCHYEGKSKVKGGGCAGMAFGLLLIIAAALASYVSLTLSAIAALAGLALIVGFIFAPAKQVCSQCGWEHCTPINPSDDSPRRRRRRRDDDDDDE